MRNSKFYIIDFCVYNRILFFVLCVLNFTGCAMAIEGAKGFAGISTKVLEEKRGEAIIDSFDYDDEDCYNKAKAILLDMGAYIYSQDAKRKMLGIYLSQTDTTPVGLFFQRIDATHTRIEVSSPSVSAKEFIAQHLFFRLK